MRCTHCGFENPPNFKFCGQCGHRLIVPEDHAERRQITVMFCDIVGSTVLSEKLDPEDWREIVRAYQRVCAKVIDTYEGQVAQYLGDGVLVYFGYPKAHEDAGQRAVRTGLGILEGLQRLNEELKQQFNLTIAVRIGIHTGLAVVGEVGGGSKREDLALGDTSNIAARLQNFAAPDTMVISGVTHRLVDGYFACQFLGSHYLKGISDTTEIYRVLRPSQARGRLDVTQSNGLTPLIGRRTELRELHRLWQSAKTGKGQAVVISGEAGIGKSRLVQMFKQVTSDDRHVWFDCRGSAYHRNTFLFGLTELVQRVLQLNRGRSTQERLDDLERTLRGYRFDVSDTIPMFAALLSIPLEERYPEVTLMTAPRRKQKTLEAIADFLRQIASRRPAIVVFDDLHWVDPSTVEFLQLIINQISEQPIFLLMTTRPDFESPWRDKEQVRHIDLERLDGAQIEQIVLHLTKGKTLPQPLLQQIIAKTDGVPLFVEELTKMVLELEMVKELADRYDLTEPLTRLTIPTTLQDSLMARLDHLPSGRDVAQLAATIGREVPYQLLQSVADRDDSMLQKDVAQLVEAELLNQQGQFPQATHIFRHALIQEIAYRSLLRRKRQSYHKLIAETLEERFPDIVATQPELLANHYTAAKLPQQAIFYWRQAGKQAIDRSANVEATQHLQHALELLQAQPESPARIQTEIELQITRGLPLLMTKGYAATEVEQVYGRARTLCKQVGDTPHIFPVQYGLWVFYLVRADHQTASLLSYQLFELSSKYKLPSMALQAQLARGVSAFYQGKFQAAREHLSESVQMYEPVQHHGAQGSLYGGADHGVVSQLHLALTVWMLGEASEADEKMGSALGLAQRLKHPFSEALALCGMAWLAQCQKRVEQTLQYAEAAYRLAHEHGFVLWEALALILRGWALAEQGDLAEGLRLLLQGLGQHQRTGATLGESHFMALLTEAHSQQGQIRQSLAPLLRIIPTMTRTGEFFYEAELYRLKGELLWAQRKQGDKRVAVEEIIDCFEHALTVADQQSAKFWELRSALSFAQFQQAADEAGSARQRLVSVCAQFDPTDQQADLVAARAWLLQET